MVWEDGVQVSRWEEFGKVWRSVELGSGEEFQVIGLGSGLVLALEGWRWIAGCFGEVWGWIWKGFGGLKGSGFQREGGGRRC